MARLLLLSALLVAASAFAPVRPAARQQRSQVIVSDLSDPNLLIAGLAIPAIGAVAFSQKKEKSGQGYLTKAEKKSFDYMSGRKQEVVILGGKEGGKSAFKERKFYGEKGKRR